MCVCTMRSVCVLCSTPCRMAEGHYYRGQIRCGGHGKGETGLTRGAMRCPMQRVRDALPPFQVVVVLSGSMEPGFYRGDILFLNMGYKPIRTGEIVVFNIDGRDIPIVHRVIKVCVEG